MALPCSLQPGLWEDNEASRDLMQKHMQRIRDARIASGTEERRAAEEAQAAAALFDARARTWAYDFNRPVAEYYDRFMPNYRAMDAAKLGDTEARLAEEMGVIASSQVQPAQKRKRRKDGQSVTVQVPEEVQFSGENVWRPANRPQYTEEQLAARRAQSTLDPEDQANWLETPRGRYGIRYEVWELADLLPSNDPFNQFQRMADYPPTAQERAYHRVPAEQEKVRRNAAILNPRYLVSDSPDASSGPPVVTTDGVVLGGNSRTMSMQLAFTKPEKLREYRDYLAARSQNYGIDPASFANMEAPVLVRVLQGGMNPDEMSIASNAFNQVATEELDVVAEGVSKSRRIDSRILTEIGSALENYDTLREYMGSRESRDLVQMLIEREIIAPNQVGRMVNAKTGQLTSTGKDLLESALRGLIIQNYDILANASENVASVLRKIDRAININEICDVNPFGVVALQAAYNEGGEWLDSLNEYLYGNYTELLRFFRERMPAIGITRLEGTYLVWADIRSTGMSSDELNRRLISEGHVMMNSGTMYGKTAGEGFLRINIACPRSRMLEGLERMARVIEKL